MSKHLTKQLARLSSRRKTAPSNVGHKGGPFRAPGSMNSRKGTGEAAKHGRHRR